MTIKKLIRNPNGLTLLELLAVVVIIAIISAIAVPTFGTIIENTKRDTHISNAIHIAEAAKMRMNSTSLESESMIGKSIKLDILISEGYIYRIKDPSTNGDYYDQDNSTVEISKNGNDFEYKVKLVRNGASTENHSYTSGDKDVYSLKREDIDIDIP